MTGRAIEKAILGISLRDEIQNNEIKRRTEVTDVVRRITKLKLSWTRHQRDVIRRIEKTNNILTKSDFLVFNNIKILVENHIILFS